MTYNFEIITVGYTILTNEVMPFHIVRSGSLDTLFIDNNSPTQWSIKMKFALLGSPLKSTQMHFKTASFGEGTKKL